jgi:two-component system sensor histidine kinase KdpD
MDAHAREDRGASEPSERAGPPPSRAPRILFRWDVERYLAAAGVAGLATALGGILQSSGFREAIVMVYLLGVLLVAMQLGRVPALVNALLGAAAHAYFYVPPLFSFAITNPEHLVPLAAYVIVALAVGSLTAQLRQFADLAGARARHADALRALSQDLAKQHGREAVLRLAALRAGEHLLGHAVAFAVGADGRLEGASSSTGEVPALVRDLAVQVLAEDRALHAAGAPGAEPSVFAVPLRGPRAVLGVLVVIRGASAGAPSAQTLQLFEDLAHLTAEALERARLIDQAERSEVDARSERLRNSLLSSVSHDLRTPLGVIIGAMSHLLDHEASLGAAERTELARTAKDEAERLNLLVGNVLAMTRLEAGAVRATKEWQPLEDVVGAALGRMSAALDGRPVRVRLPADLPLVPLDPVLIERVLVNLLENVSKHTEAGAPVEVSAHVHPGDGVVVEVRDHGPGLKPGSEREVFERFGTHPRSALAGGLGLAVCRGILTVHGGRIWAENRPDGGAAFSFTLPLEGAPPSPVPVEA